MVSSSQPQSKVEESVWSQVDRLVDRVRWVDGLPAPGAAELLSLAQPSSTGVDGIGALPPVEHALVVSANAWAHKPLRRARDLVDVAALTATLDRAALDTAARAW